MNELKNANFTVGLNNETAAWLNGQHRRMERGTRLLLDIALDMGEVLSTLQKNHVGNLQSWIDANLVIPHTSAMRYIRLYEYRDQVSGAENLTQAYKQIETLEAQKKQTETQKAYQRVAEYKKTGEKPEGWRRGTDDKLLKEEQERNERIEAVKKEAIERQEAKERERATWEANRAEGRRIVEEASAEKEPDIWTAALTRQIEAEKKRQEFKTNIRLSADGMVDPFQDAILDYLNGLSDDNRRVEACYNIIKICKRIANELQAGGTE